MIERNIGLLGTEEVPGRPAVHAEADPSVAVRRSPGMLVRALASSCPVVLGDAIVLVSAMFVARTSVGVGFLAVGVALLTLWARAAYRSRLTLSATQSAPIVTTSLAIVFVIVTVVELAFDEGAVPRAPLVALAIAIPVVIAVRALTYEVVRVVRRRNPTPTLVLGAGDVGSRIVAALLDHPELGLKPVGILDDLPPLRATPVPFAGNICDLQRVATALGARKVILAFWPTTDAAAIATFRSALRIGVDLFVVPRLFELGIPLDSARADSVWGIPLYQIRPYAPRSTMWIAKRVVDILLSIVLLLVTAPLFVLGAILAKIGSSGPIFFRQTRVGRGGEDVQILKLRTLPVNHVDRKLNASDDEYASRASLFLRRTSLDELPQLWNVLRGEMSLVGPRPERRYLVEQFNESIDGYVDRHRLPVGLTGWAQVHGLRGASSLEDRIRFDNQYIEGWSLGRDLATLARTPVTILRSLFSRSEPPLRPTTAPVLQSPRPAKDLEPRCEGEEAERSEMESTAR